MAIELRGKKSANTTYELIRKRMLSLDFKPYLVVVLIGEDPASQVYVNKKIKTCKNLGFASRKISLPETTSQSELLEILASLNQDQEVDGILVQLPLPASIDAHTVVETIDPLKDVDALTSKQVGALAQAKAIVSPCTPTGVMQILKDNDINLEGKTAVVVGRSQIVGQPMFQLLQQAGATVTLCHSKTKDIKAHTLRADIVVVAVGKREFFGKDYFNTNAVVIDVGIHRKEGGSICGDVKQEEIKDHVSAYTPVPGGVGPMTIAMLMKNTLELSLIRRNK